jgi:hypothetical protein
MRTALADGATVGEAWVFLATKESELFGEDISSLKPLVMAALGFGDDKIS